MISFFKLTLYIPLYNLLVFLASVMPKNDIGLAIVVLTLGVKTALFPLQHKASKTQSKMKTIEPELSKIKENKNKEEQAKQMMELYKEHGINPFSSILLLFIQIPIIMALYFVFLKGFSLNLDILYTFTPKPATTNSIFLGLVDIHTKSYLFALLVGVTQFFQIRLAMPAVTPNPDSKGTFGADFQKSMNVQMRYVMPVIIMFVSASLPVAVSIYWITSNVFSICHELFVKRLLVKN